MLTGNLQSQTCRFPSSASARPSRAVTLPCTTQLRQQQTGQSLSKRLRSLVQAAAAADEPNILVKVITPENPSQPLEIECPSGEQLRACMLENKVDLYTTWGKIWSCGGAGQCGTCIVQVVDGADLLSERTETEDKKLNKKPDNWRLACQTIVGDGTNTGSVTVQTKPQSK